MTEKNVVIKQTKRYKIIVAEDGDGVRRTKKYWNKTGKVKILDN